MLKAKNIGGKRADTQSQEKNGGSVEVVKRIFSLFSTFFSCFRREKCSFTFYVTTAILCTDYKKRGVAFLHSFPSIFPFLYKIQKWYHEIKYLCLRQLRCLTKKIFSQKCEKNIFAWQSKQQYFLLYLGFLCYIYFVDTKNCNVGAIQNWFYKILVLRNVQKTYVELENNHLLNIRIFQFS